MNKMNAKGFTLLELMIVVLLLSIMVLISVPMFAEMVHKSKSGATKGNIAVLRSVLNVYSADQDGKYPSGPPRKASTLLNDELVPKYLDEIPDCHISPLHAKSNTVVTKNFQARPDEDLRIWGYDSLNNTGQIWIVCTHQDDKGTIWKEF